MTKGNSYTPSKQAISGQTISGQTISGQAIAPTASTPSDGKTPLEQKHSLDASLLIDVHGANVTLRHEKLCHTVLHNIKFQLFAGEHCAIVGANGSGKSTFLRLVRGEVWADNPTLNFNESQVTWYVQQGPANTMEPHNHHLAQATLVAEKSPIMGRRMTALVSAAKQEVYVRHEWRLTGQDILLTAFSDAELLHFIPNAAQHETIVHMAKKIKATHLLHQEACTLSQGQLRLLLLGRALLREPQVLLLDECMDGLDKQARQHFLQLLEDWLQEAPSANLADTQQAFPYPANTRTVIFSDHRATNIPPWVQHSYSMQEGHLQKIPTKPLAAVEKSSQIFIPEQVTTQQNIKQDGLLSHSQEAPIFIHMAHADVYIERKALLHNLNWTWRKGEHWMLHGENGAGKSTFLRLLASQEYVAFGGTLQRFYEKQGNFVPAQDIYNIQSCTALLSDREQQCYGYDVTGIELVLSGLEQVQGVYREYSEEEYAAASQLLFEFHLQSLTDRPIRSLSTGQLRRLLLARLCIARPQLLLLDEPFSGLDQKSYFAMRHMLEVQTTRPQNAAHIMLVSHYQEDRLPCINKDAMLKEGILTELPPFSA